MLFLKELEVIEEEDELIKCIPETILVENYVYLQVLLRRYSKIII